MMKEPIFSNIVKEKRQNDLIKPYELAYTTFLKLRYDKKEKSYFLKNASTVVDTMRKQCWQTYLVSEENFSKSIFKSLYDNEQDETLTNKAAVYKFIDNHLNDFYALSLSNTQSRRSRAGTEFEAIIELLFIGAGMMIDSQGFLSSIYFEEQRLGKAVDLVAPGVLEYSILKRNCSLISCKTSLRERWAEVIEEKDRTGASEIYLATLDEKISANTLKILNDKNVIPVVTKHSKDTWYSLYTNVITYEELLEIIRVKNEHWNPTLYSPEQLAERMSILDRQMERHHALSYHYIYQFYYLLKTELLNLPEK